MSANKHKAPAGNVSPLQNQHDASRRHITTGKPRLRQNRKRRPLLPLVEILHAAEAALADLGLDIDLINAVVNNPSSSGTALVDIVRTTEIWGSATGNDTSPTPIPQDLPTRYFMWFDTCANQFAI